MTITQPERVATRTDRAADVSARTSAAARPGLLLGLVLTGQFMALLDVTIVNVAVPGMRVDLHAGGAALQLVVAGYGIAYAVLLITGARLGERHGFTRLFLGGLALFTAASLACGLAPGVGALIGFRLLQGLGAALMVPQVMSLIQRTFTGPARVRALGVYSAVLAVGGVTGQVVGGALVSANLFGWGWRPVFLVNVPIGVALLVAGARLLPSVAGERTRQLDLRGMLLLAAAIGSLVIPLVLGHDENWPLWCWALLGASVALFTAFVLVERGLARSGGHPLIHSRVLRAPGLVPAAAAMFLVMTGVAGFSFSLAMHLQAGLGVSALRSGLTVAPTMLGFGAAGLWWQRLPQRLHGGLPQFALVAAASAFAAVALLARDGAAVSWSERAALLAIGIAGGCAYSPLFARALGCVAPEHAADASGVMVTVLQLGQVVGVAALGTLFLSQVHYPGATPASSGTALAITLGAVAALMLGAAVLVRPVRGGSR
ncbi:MFS transporter [Streptacidiphilus jiangxiensis]|uniref:Major Facilitator Superfamily protein n=1 Tax=Streptacidiphilus jiangxiensis TaxID=235985 RepID=A0A1H7S790_STRJI|nr:MFS transporter [Streptacidiphilus jiangxiensis]SEL68500.1 Major Facilitator Superfamily protein [Streptacidiphilus jiangxiensis]